MSKRPASQPLVGRRNATATFSNSSSWARQPLDNNPPDSIRRSGCNAPSSSHHHHSHRRHHPRRFRLSIATTAALAITCLACTCVTAAPGPAGPNGSNEPPPTSLAHVPPPPIADPGHQQVFAAPALNADVPIPEPSHATPDASLPHLADDSSDTGSSERELRRRTTFFEHLAHYQNILSNVVGGGGGASAPSSLAASPPAPAPSTPDIEPVPVGSGHQDSTYNPPPVRSGDGRPLEQDGQHVDSAGAPAYRVEYGNVSPEAPFSPSDPPSPSLPRPTPPSLKPRSATPQGLFDEERREMVFFTLFLAVGLVIGYLEASGSFNAPYSKFRKERWSSLGYMSTRWGMLCINVATLALVVAVYAVYGDVAGCAFHQVTLGVWVVVYVKRVVEILTVHSYSGPVTVVAVLYMTAGNLAVTTMSCISILFTHQKDDTNLPVLLLPIPLILFGLLGNFYHHLLLARLRRFRRLYATSKLLSASSSSPGPVCTAGCCAPCPACAAGTPNGAGGGAAGSTHPTGGSPIPPDDHDQHQGPAAAATPTPTTTPATTLRHICTTRKKHHHHHHHHHNGTTAPQPHPASATTAATTTGNPAAHPSSPTHPTTSDAKHGISARLRAAARATAIVMAKPYRIPRGGLFYHTACPHYLLEVVAWFGFAVMVHRPSAYGHVLYVGFKLAGRAWQTRKWYLQNVPGYPPNRTSIVPFLL
ncbi:Steroid 5-alpha-reductase det2 [Phlyctochytrium bullatum]|nr:Steroid 5-alpha-reductase det2 [Phlyctochytrium bullatum]